MISLVIPTLNEAKTLGKTLVGLSDEIKKRYLVELIVSDGGSSDDTQELARQLGARVVLPEPGVKQNIAVGRNAGAVVASGEILIFLDADTRPRDWEKLLRAANEAFEDDKVAAATVSVEIEPAERKLRDLFWLNLYNLMFFCQTALGFGMGRGNCQIVRAATFKEVGGYNEDLSAAEDYDLYRRLGKLGKIRILWRVVVYESPRRFRRYGYLRVGAWWFLNAVSVVLRKRSWSRVWQRVR